MGVRERVEPPAAPQSIRVALVSWTVYEPGFPLLNVYWPLASDVAVWRTVLPLLSSKRNPFSAIMDVVPFLLR